jgi:multiple sugar transport system permease protein
MTSALTHPRPRNLPSPGTPGEGKGEGFPSIANHNSQIANSIPALLLHLAISLLAIVSLIPFFWLICATFKLHEDFFNYAFLPWRQPQRWTLGNYIWLFTREPFARWLVNSLFLSSAQTAIVVTLSCLGGFALAKYRFRGRKPLMIIMLATMLLPSQVLLGSSQELMYHLGWIDSYAAIIVPGAISVFGMFLFMQAMKTVPDELLAAGRVDGCSEFRLWWELALPIVRPMIGAYTLLSFMGAWNSFLWPQIILQTPEKYTLPIALANMINLPEYQTPYGVLMAGTLLSILPVSLLFFILQRDFISGLASGAVKG